MAIVTIFSAEYCREKEVIENLMENSRHRHATNDQIISEAAVLSGMDKEKVRRALSFKTSVFEKFTHEKKFALAYIKLVLSKMLLVSAGRDLILNGYASQLIPREITHFFRVGLVADRTSRVAALCNEKKISEREAEKQIYRLDEEQALWLHRYCRMQEAFNPADYDLIIPMHREPVEEAAGLILGRLGEDFLKPNDGSIMAVKDFNLQARVEVELARSGHDLIVNAVNDKVSILIDKNVPRLNRFKKELLGLVENVSGVGDVEIGLADDFRKSDVYRKYDRNRPSRVLLVDDEQEFAKTLSERLSLRDMGSAVVHDGESALELIDQDRPDVMVLDLKMPGVDGIEVLRRVKETTPDIEVIVLTGDGSEDDRKKCLEMGAFAYLYKPLDIAELSGVINEANGRVNR